MGATLSNPVEAVRVQRQQGLICDAAVADMQGWRDGHEDAHFMHQPQANGWAHFGVFDGHGGTKA